jgi:hypothetical protein
VRVCVRAYLYMCVCESFHLIISLQKKEFLGHLLQTSEFA